MKKLTIIICLLAFQHISTLCFGQTNNSLLKTQNYVQYVNPFIGTGGHGHTFPGATTPFGMVQLSPDTRIDGSWDGCGGYYYNDSIIYGFSHTHLSGTGCSDYGDIAFLPMFEETMFTYQNDYTYSETYRHENEKAEAGYYKVLLNNSVNVELTSTPRVGLQRYTFTKNGYAYIELNLLHRDELLEGSIHQVSKTHFSGIRRSKAWAKNQTLFYDFEINKEPKAINIVKGKNGDEKLFLYFDKVNKGDEILIKTGISACDEKGALNNRITELPGWDFEKTKKAARDLWNKELGKIEVSNEDKNKSTIFYTALYHCMIHPSLYSDVDNRYRGRDDKIHSTEGKFDYYTVFSLWDTYRALHPLLTIIDTKRTNDFINTFLCQYQQGGRLPVWELSSNETDCMIGYHSVSVIWDAYNKGIRGFDANLAFEAMKHSAMEDRNGLKFYKEKGYISSEDDNESVSKTLEYAYDDWCIAQMAKALGKTDDYNYFEKRSENWKNLFNPETGFFQAKKNGSWINNFDPYEVNNNYTEANAWQYSVSVPHDLEALNSLYKTKNSITKHLDKLFSANEKTNGRNQADISGLIGQYAHGNEPSHHLIYCYDEFTSNEKKIVSKAKKILFDFYKNSPDGLIGNEDCGQMSAWYVMSAMGLYQVKIGTFLFYQTLPLFKSINIVSDVIENKISIESKQTIKIDSLVSTIKWVTKEPKIPLIKITNSSSSSTIKGVTTSSKRECCEILFDYNNNYLKDSYPFRTVTEITPFFNNPTKNFTDSFRVEIQSIGLCHSAEPVIKDDGKTYEYKREKPPIIYFSINKREFRYYEKPFIIHESCKIDAYSMNVYTNEKSPVITSEFRMLPSNRRLQLISKYDNLYAAGGDDALIDLERGSENWRIGNWQGYAGKDFVGIVDVGSSKTLKSIGLGCLQDQGAWVMMPPQVIFEGSNDGKIFEPISTVKTNVSDTIDHAITKDVMLRFGIPVSAAGKAEGQPNIKAKSYRYYRVTAKNYGKLPSWHWSKGEPAWLFVDEILIEE